MHLANRMQDISPFHVMELMGRAKALEASGRDIVHMEVGEPDFPTTAPVIAAAKAFLDQGEVFYTAALGLPELRNSIAADYRRRYGVTINPERVVITAGASAALLIALGVLVNRDEEWLLPDPGYPCNANFLRLLEGTPRRIPVSATQNFQPTPTDIEHYWRPITRGLMVASPANPTGTLLSAQELSALHHAVTTRGGTLIVDEIYHGLTYGTQAATATAISDDIFVINSFSKYFGMTGWRLGWLIVPPAYLNEVEKLAQNLFISPPTLSQHAALAAFSEENIALLEKRRAEFQQRRDFLKTGLEELGFVIGAAPDGAFYLYADISALASDSFAFTKGLLEEAGVAATPGIDFGPHDAARYMRFAYTTDIERLQEGLKRIQDFLKKHDV